jgi:protein-tyrosine phosphatase
VRGRGLRYGLPDGPEPEFGVYLLASRPPATPWPSRWIRWRDWWLPADLHNVRAAVRELHQPAPVQRVEVACTGGQGRTGTLLACLAVLDGVPPAEAVSYVRSRYDPHAVETPWQRRYVRRFRP